MQNTPTIDIWVNDAPERVPAGSSLQAIIDHVGEADPHLIVELNGRFVYPRNYAAIISGNGDRIELINPHFGG